MDSVADRPNVLIFCVDQMRADHMGCAGNAVVRTPNLDRLAAMGTRFSRAYCNNPICMPARASMFTGMLPRDHGVHVNGQALREDLPVLPGILAEAGYRTHAAGKLHLTPWVPMVSPPDPQQYPECLDYWGDGHIQKFPQPYYGFQTVDFVGGHASYAYGEYIQWLRDRGGDPADLTEPRTLEQLHGPGCYKMAVPEDLHYNRYIADSTIRVVKETADESGAPFFAWCSFPDPHHPFAPPAPYCHMYDPEDMPPPSRREGELDRLPPIYRRIVSGQFKPHHCDNSAVGEEDRRQMLALTCGMVSHIDTEVGRVLDALDETGLTDNTVIAFISDHGDMMGDHRLFWKGMYTFRGCVNIPLLVAAPGMSAGPTSDALVSQIDLMPSILDLCDVPLPGSQWTRQEEPFQRGFEMPLNLYPGRSWTGLLDGTADSIRDAVVIENDDPTSGYLVRALVTRTHRLTVYPGTRDGELFDLADDPHELDNLWYDPACAQLRADLTRQLLDEYTRCTPAIPIPPWNS